MHGSPRAIASFGMPNTTHECSSSAMVSAPDRRSATMPSAPSAPMPVSSSGHDRHALQARDRREHHVNGRPLVMHGRPLLERRPQFDAEPIDDHVIVARGDVPRSTAAALRCPWPRPRESGRARSEAFGEGAREVGGHVLRDHDGRHVGRQPRQQGPRWPACHPSTPRWQSGPWRASRRRRRPPWGACRPVARRCGPAP